MKSLFGGIAICMLAGVLSAGCTGCSEASHPEELQTYGDDPTGTGGTNGLTPAVFHQWAGQLNELMSQSALTTSQVAEPPITTKLYVFDLNPAYAAFYQNLIDSKGTKILDYAIGCAFGKDYGVQYPNQRTAWGNGLLSVAQSWAIGPLDAYQRNAVFTCLVTRMNAAGEEVPIRLLGKSVANTPLNRGDAYFFKEAVWLARWEPINKTAPSRGGLFVDVWPSPTLLSKVKVNLDDKIRSRVCDQAQANCGVHIHSSPSDQGSGCEKIDGYWSCWGRPAIETRLSEPGWNVIYQTLP